MFDNTHLPNLDEAALRVLSILANVADITETRNYIFDVKLLDFKPKVKGKLILRLQISMNTCHEAVARYT